MYELIICAGIFAISIGGVGLMFAYVVEASNKTVTAKLDAIEKTLLNIKYR
jgi:hypothetical protein